MTLALVVGLLVAAVALWPAAGAQLPTRPGVATRDRPGHGDGAAAGDGTTPRGRRGRARRVALEGALADLVAAVAAPRRAGVAPSVALAAAAPSCADDPALGPLLRDLVEATRTGTSAAAVWLRHAPQRAPMLIGSPP